MNQSGETRFCPWCGEEIKAQAIKCKHCGSLLEEGTSLRQMAEGPTATAGGQIHLPQWLGPNAFSPGSMLREYRIERKLGEGGMGEVYLAVDTNTGRSVALKMVAPECIRDEGIRRRFIEEARVMAGLRHPNVVSLYAFMEEQGALFLAMEYVDGPSLEQVLRQGRPGLDDVVRVSRAVLSALEYTHSVPQPVVHRDVKPANVLLGTDGRIYLTDFGVAKAMGREKLTRTRGIVGTCEYMSPEQVLGEPVAPASDIYSFGVMLYRMLVGQVPFPQQTDSGIDAMTGHTGRAVPRIEDERQDVPDWLLGVVYRCLEKEPGKRFFSASEALACFPDLASSGGGTGRTRIPVASKDGSAPDGVVGQPEARRSVVSLPGSRRGALVIGVGLAIALALVVVAVLLSQASREGQSDASSERIPMPDSGTVPSGAAPAGESSICVPDCLSKACGPDGCGGDCGVCPAGQECQGAVCRCVPSCAGKDCGPDGCGGVCGSCKSGEECAADRCRVRELVACPYPAHNIAASSSSNDDPVTWKGGAGDLLAVECPGRRPFHGLVGGPEGNRRGGMDRVAVPGEDQSQGTSNLERLPEGAVRQVGRSLLHQ